MIWLLSQLFSPPLLAQKHTQTINQENKHGPVPINLFVQNQVGVDLARRQEFATSVL